MKEIKDMTLDEVLQFIYDNLGNILAVVELIILGLLKGKISKSSDLSAHKPSAPLHTVEPVTVETVSKVDVSAKKKALKSQMLADIELFFSDTPDEELSEVQQARIQRVLDYIQGGSQ